MEVMLHGNCMDDEGDMAYSNSHKNAACTVLKEMAGVINRIYSLEHCTYTRYAISSIR